MPQGLNGEESTLLQVMAWCHQAPSHYLSQWWPRSMIPHGITRPQWVNSMAPPGRCSCSYSLISSEFPMKLFSNVSHMASLMISQHWFRYWLDVIRQLAVIWTNADQVAWCHNASLAASLLNFKRIFSDWSFILMEFSLYSGTPLEGPLKMVAFQKRWPVMRGKINMICKEWCMEMDPILQL